MTHPDKKSLRREIKAKLEAQSSAEREKRSLIIQEKLFSLDVFNKAVSVCIYVSTPTEVDTTSMIDQALGMGKRVLVPLSNLENKELELYEIKNRQEYLTRGTFGIMEPIPGKARLASTSEVDCVIVPGVVFDRAGHRIGHGKGFYDRFLDRLPAGIGKIGLSFSFQVISKIPNESHDKPLDIVLTD